MLSARREIREHMGRETEIMNDSDPASVDVLAVAYRVSMRTHLERRSVRFALLVPAGTILRVYEPAASVGSCQVPGVVKLVPPTEVPVEL
jgi:hypothetical protein